MGGRGLVPANRAWGRARDLEDHVTRDLPSTASQISQTWATGRAAYASVRGSPHLHSEPPGKRDLRWEGDALWLHQPTKEESQVSLIKFHQSA